MLFLLLLVGLLCLLTDGTTATRTYLEDALKLLEALSKEVLRLLPQGGRGCVLMVKFLNLLLLGGSLSLFSGFPPDSL